MAVTITGTSGAVTYDDAITGLHGIAGQYWLAAPYEGPRHAIDKIKAPGQQGSAVKRHGFESRTIRIGVVYVAASANACRAARDADEALMANQPLSVSIPGAQPLPSCEFIAFNPVKGPHPTELGTYRYHLSLEFDQLRP